MYVFKISRQLPVISLFHCYFQAARQSDFISPESPRHRIHTPPTKPSASKAYLFCHGNPCRFELEHEWWCHYQEDQDAAWEPSLSCSIRENYISELNDHDTKGSHQHKVLRVYINKLMLWQGRNWVWHSEWYLCVCDFKIECIRLLQLAGRSLLVFSETINDCHRVLILLSFGDKVWCGLVRDLLPRDRD